MTYQCQGITQKGLRCRLQVRGSPYCRFHRSQANPSQLQPQLKPPTVQRYSSIHQTVSQASPTLQKLVRESPVKTLPSPQPQPRWSCCVCLDQEVAEEDLLVCRHPLCLSCLSKLAQRRCPICRERLASPSVTPAIIRSIEAREKATMKEFETKDQLIAEILQYHQEADLVELYDLEISQLEELLVKEKIIRAIQQTNPLISRKELENRDINDLEVIQVALDL